MVEIHEGAHQVAEVVNNGWKTAEVVLGKLVYDPRDVDGADEYN